MNRKKDNLFRNCPFGVIDNPNNVTSHIGQGR